MPRPETCWSVSTAVTSNGSARATVSVPLFRETGMAQATARDFRRDQRQHLLVDRNAVQVDRLAAGLAAEKFRQRLRLDEAKLNDDVSELPTVPLLLAAREFQLRVGQHARGEELLA